MKDPDFILVGESRCGSTSLYEALIKHPDIILPTTNGKPFSYEDSNIDLSQKELRFFDRHWSNGIEWYRNRFPDNGKIVGDGSATYLFLPSAMRRIKCSVPNVKLLILLRNPIDRLCSHFYHKSKIDPGWTDVSFDEFVYLQNDHHMIARGIYINSIKNCFNLFDESQILITRSEDLFKGRALNNIFEFLGLSNSNTLGHFRKSCSKSMRPETYQYLSEFYKPYNEELSSFLGKNMGWDE